MSSNRTINAVIEGFVSADSATKQEQGRRFAYVLGLTPGPAGADGGIDGYGVVDGSKIYFQSKLKSSKLGAEEAGIFYSNLVLHQADIGILLAGVGYTAATPSLPNAGFRNRVRASQSGLTQGFKNNHHVIITHGCPVPFLSQATR